MNTNTNAYMFSALQSLMPNIDPETLKDKSLSDCFPCKENHGQVIIFDQLEELFNTYPDRWIEQQKEFFQQINDSLENNSFLRIIFIIREDYLASIDSCKNIFGEKLRPRFRLERLRKNEAISAIKGPLQKIMNDQSDEYTVHPCFTL
jgi:hypothetical protein